MPAPVEIHVPRGRLDALADGVYAIAVTLLVLELRLPPLGAGVSQAALIEALQGLVPKVLVWLLSFWVAALLWASSVRVSRLAGDDGKPTVVLELSQLALVSLLPFSTALMGEHGDFGIVAALYSAHLCALALLGALRATIALPRHGASSERRALETRRHLLSRSWVACGCAALALALSFVVPGWNMLALLPLAAHGWLMRLLPGAGRR